MFFVITNQKFLNILNLQHTPVVASTKQNLSYSTISFNHILQIISDSLVRWKNRKKKHRRLSLFQSHYIISEPFKIASLFRLGHEISDHFTSWTVLYLQVSFFLLVVQKEISDVNGPCSFARTRLTIIQK